VTNYLQQLEKEYEKLAKDGSPDSVVQLKKALEVHDGGTFEKHIIPYIACRALIYKGVAGIKALAEVLPVAPGFIYPIAILASLWRASEGKHATASFEEFSKNSVLNQPIADDVRKAAKEKFVAFLDDCRTDPGSFHRLINLLYHEQMQSMFDRESNDHFHKVVFKVLADSTLRISDRHLEQFDELLAAGAREEEYQRFLTANPVFLNPLGSQLISKQKLGDDFITDYVLETLTGDYVAVEIEKPTDPLFTQTNDFSYQFTHAFGQVIDFIEWIEQNIAYAQKKLPGIAAPKGLLVIGMRSSLTATQANKLRRFNQNSSSVQVATFDDLLSNARSLQRNIRHHVGFVSNA
jgi:hypothetical protein